MAHPLSPHYLLRSTICQQLLASQPHPSLLCRGAAPTFEIAGQPTPTHVQFEVYTRQSAHPTGYFMAFTDGQKDIDVSAHMCECQRVRQQPCCCLGALRVLHEACASSVAGRHMQRASKSRPWCGGLSPLSAGVNRVFEPMYTYAWHTLLSAGCRGPNGERRLVVDVGANVSRSKPCPALASLAACCACAVWRVCLLGVCCDVPL